MPRGSLLFDPGGVHKGMSKINPRYSNGWLRRKYRARFKCMNAECGICHGKLGPIHYDEPSNAAHPFSFVIDEIRPISLYKQFGYESARAACEDWNNLQAAHYCCNAAKSNKVGYEIGGNINKIPSKDLPNALDGAW